MNKFDSISITVKGEKDGEPVEFVFELVGDEHTDVSTSIRNHFVTKPHHTGIFNESVPTGRYDFDLKVKNLTTKERT
jgi:hypothetical protein